MHNQCRAVYRVNLDEPLSMSDDGERWFHRDCVDGMTRLCVFAVLGVFREGTSAKPNVCKAAKPIRIERGVCTLCIGAKYRSTVASRTRSACLLSAMLAWFN